MRVCQLCGKGVQSGHNVSHSQRKTKRKWIPNLQYRTMEIDGEKTRIRICAKCLRNQSKAKKEKPKK
jgi:large subunit ribosomal protein L28